MPSEEPKVTPGPEEGEALERLIWGFTASQAVSVAARLGIADVLRDQPKTPGEIASALGADESAVRRLLRALTTVDLFVEDERGRFAATSIGQLLESDHPRSLRAFATCFGSPLFWRSWENLHQSILTGKPAFDQVYGQPFFEYLAHTPDAGAAFNAAITSRNRGDLPAILAAYDFSGCSKIVDVGGGQGTFLRGILERYPDATGVLFDLPSVVAEARDLKESPVAARYAIVGGDMFEAIPPGGDAYILKGILHDWADAEALGILRNCRRAIVDEGRILAADLIIAPANQPDFAKWLDLNMLVTLTGRERTETEFRDLYAAAGFRLTRIIPTAGPALIEGVPV
jgi:hypothetical protein